jgi:hypothetical protein
MELLWQTEKCVQKRDRIPSGTLSLFIFKVKLEQILPTVADTALVILLDKKVLLVEKDNFFMDNRSTMLSLLLAEGPRLPYYGSRFAYYGFWPTIIIIPCPINSLKLCIRQFDFSCGTHFTYNSVHWNISFLLFMLQKLFIYGVRNTTSRFIIKCCI